MNKKIKVLYVYGFEGWPKDFTYNGIEYLLRDYENIKLLSFDWDMNDDPLKTYADLVTYIKHNSIDILVGFSIGGYFSAGVHDIPKVLANPVLKKEQFLSLKMDPNKYYMYDKFLWDNYGFKNSKYTWMCVGTRDYELGMNSFNYSKELFKSTKHLDRIIIENCNHKMTLDNLRIVVDGIMKIINFYPYLNKRFTYAT